MPATGLNKVLDHLRRWYPAPEHLTDNHLMERFLATGDDAAFAALVHRHGRMVLGVCRRILGNVHDCEDVFQAVFFVLARRARSVAKREALGSWLYTVAYRMALEARTVRHRRQRREVSMADLPHPETKPEFERDWQPILDRELNLLPRKDRSLVVLCDLEGKSRKEAARQLGLKEGTVSSRLARARRRLAARLARYGLSLSGGALAAALAEGTASATVPVSLVLSTARAATLVAAGQCAGLSVSALTLMKGAMKTMFLAKLKTVIATGVVAVVVGLGGLAYQAEFLPQRARAADGAKPLSELEALRKENELLKINLQVTLEKIQAQEAELARLRSQIAPTQGPAPSQRRQLGKDLLPELPGRGHTPSQRRQPGGQDLLPELPGQNLAPDQRRQPGSKDLLPTLPGQNLVPTQKGRPGGKDLLPALPGQELAPKQKAAVPGQDANKKRDDKKIKDPRVDDTPSLPGDDPLAAEVQGQIKKTDDSGLVIINIGSDAGLAKGDTLEVYRSKPAKYLGKVRVIDVKPNEAVAQPVSKLRESVEVGDHVASKIAAGGTP
jgi:RNA polymerase sigma factor (sigma-70 family)